MLVVAYVGFGNSVCRYHLPYVEVRSDKVKVKYIYRRPEDVEIEGKEKESYYPEIKFVYDFNEILNDPEVNLVVINSPNATHVTYTKMCLQHGKNVLCEKPFAMSVEEAKEVFALAKEKGLTVMPNQNRRFDADMRTVRKVLQSGVLGKVFEVESHYDYYRPTADRKQMGSLYGLQIHPIDQMIGEFGIPDRVVYDCRSAFNPGLADDYSDIDLFYGNMKAIVKTSLLVKIEYPRFIVHGTKGSFIMPQLGHQSALAKKPGKVNISFEPLGEEFYGTLCYVDENGNDVNEKVPVEVQDYGMIYDNLYDVIFNGGQKVVKDEEVLEVLRIIEEGTKAAKEAK